jgi:lysozyme
MTHLESLLRRARNSHPCLVLAALLLCASLIEAHIHSAKQTEPLPHLFAAAVPVGPPLPRHKPNRRVASDWHVNNRALNIIREAEGLRLSSYYLAGQWLVGYGHAIIEASDPSTVTITRAQANDLLRTDVSRCEAAVNRAISVRITQNEFSAMVAFCYNVGEGAFTRSSIVRYVNDGQADAAANAFLRWNHADIGGHEIEVTPLSVRRARERALFLSAVVPDELAGGHEDTTT